MNMTKEKKELEPRETLRVVEVFATLQGEGSRAGSPAVFVRLAGCNLWTGHEKDRDKGRGGCAAWCDTVFHTGGPMDPAKLAARVAGLAAGMVDPLVVITGGEPMLQLRRPSGVSFLRLLSPFTVAVETNGTIAIPAEVAALIQHVTVSPKPLRGTPGLNHVEVRKGADLKVIVPTPFNEVELVRLAGGFEHHFVQPLDTGDRGNGAAAECVEIAGRLGWRVSVQTHKHMGLP